MCLHIFSRNLILEHLDWKCDATVANFQSERKKEDAFYAERISLKSRSLEVQKFRKADVGRVINE